MYAHLDMIQAFLKSEAEYGIICEDDVHIHREFDARVREAIQAYRSNELDVLLLGYLLPYKIAEGISGYDDSQWGTQMYMLGRRAATEIYEAFQDPSKVPVFASDWTITKYGRRARMYPMLAIEEGPIDSTDQGQIWFHRQCHLAHFDPSTYL
jgi:GR25 family glycosyltransferase involved in LPS biosynthesis